MTTPPDLALFFGRFHPLVVHLPVALFLLLAFLEAIARIPRFKHANANAGIILAIAAPAAVLSALFGWLLSLGGGYQDQLLGWHKWTGIAMAATSALAALLYRLDRHGRVRSPTGPLRAALHPRNLYHSCLFFGVLLLFFTAHFGGSLTHGSDYLVRYAPGPLRQWFAKPGPPPLEATKTQSKELELFSTVVHPVLAQNCVACHGPEKSKGGLRLDTLEAMLKGGEDGAVIVPGKPAESLLLKRVRLPLSDDDHMPPDGKPQPSAQDLALLEWWVRSGAPATFASQLALNSAIPPVVARILQERLGVAVAAPKVVSPKPLEQVLPAAAKLVQDLNVALSPIASGEPWLQCNASLAGTNFANAELAQLAAVGPNLRWLDLGGTGVTDAGLALLSQMPNLTRLHLERTSITDSSLIHLSGLSKLEYLNLHHTAVTDAGIEALQPLTALRQLYLWETGVSPEAAQAFVESRTDKEQIQKWREEIERLNTSIRQAHVVADLGSKMTNNAATNALPINVACPVSDKPVAASKTLLHDGKLIAFCCDDCKAKFQQDPKAYLSKLPPLMPKDPENKPQNERP